MPSTWSKDVRCSTGTSSANRTTAGTGHLPCCPGPICFGRGGTGTLTVNGTQVAQRAWPNTLPFTVAWDETFDVGLDTGTSVDDRDYTLPNSFTERIVRLTIDLGDGTVKSASLQALQEDMMRRQIRRD
jgi:arylsulfatase